MPAGPAPMTQTSKGCSKALRSVVLASEIIGSPLLGAGSFGRQRRGVKASVARVRKRPSR